ncbi:MAG TPA: lipid-A-disaccharide synthase, partial [Prolixibacteraceae bacterium]|nr:lipid-A-disaccharide synthase [Prolixibacteraceae bacterium]
MKYFLIAGEASGDLHGARLIAELRKCDPEAELRFFGGDLMKNQGGQLLKHYRDMAFMGIIPVLLNMRKVLDNFSLCKKEISRFQPDVLILIDYPGFNLRMARYAKKNGIKTAYYISPKIWAWKTKRVKKVKKYVDHMFTIFPFETSFYEKYQYPVTYVGNPVYDIIHETLEKPSDFEQFCKSNQLSGKPIVALLAGSRKHEIKSLLPVMEKVSGLFTDYQFVIAGAPSIDAEFYLSNMESRLPIVFNQTYELLRHSKSAIVTSGTATLETALLKIPQVVVYIMGFGRVLELFRNQILKTRFFSLVNLVAEKEVVKELFQSEVTVSNLKEE